MKMFSNMKKIYTLLLFGSALFLASCSDFLEEDPQDQVFIENFFQSESDAAAAVNSIYAILNSISTPPFGGAYHSVYWVSVGLTSDEMENRFVGALNYDQMETFTHVPVNAEMYHYWKSAYKGISNANFALEGIPNIGLDAVKEDRYLGEARFLRGMLYFDLVRLFGKVPLILETNPPLRPERTDINIIYDQVIADLQFAAQGLPASFPVGNGRGRATSGAAHALLAKVYLTLGEYQACIDECQTVINSGQYGLWEDFADAFRLANENGKESIFNIGFGTANNAISFWEVGQFNVRLLPTELKGQIPGVNAQGWQVPTQDLYDAYDPQDRRRAVTMMTQVFNTNGTTTTIEPHIRKYWDEESEPQAGNTDNDLPYLRYSDIFLILAEALNELNQGPNAEAYEAINTIRERARFNGEEVLDILPDLSGLNYEQFRDAVLLERRLEFVAEGHRWFDLVRFGKLEELVPQAKPGVQPQPMHYLFPIPQEEIDLNANLLPQNQGY